MVWVAGRGCDMRISSQGGGVSQRQRQRELSKARFCFYRRVRHPPPPRRRCCVRGRDCTRQVCTLLVTVCSLVDGAWDTAARDRAPFPPLHLAVLAGSRTRCRRRCAPQQRLLTVAAHTSTVRVMQVRMAWGQARGGDVTFGCVSGWLGDACGGGSRLLPSTASVRARACALAGSCT